MPSLHRAVVLLLRARELRSAPTPAEARAWQFLRLRRCAGARFRRQHVLPGYIVDFYCPALRLVIELEGGVHQNRNQRAYDDERQRLLERHGCRVVRIRNRDASPERLLEIVQNTLLPRIAGRG